MKKAISLILALLMCLSLCACGGSPSSAKEEEKITTSYAAIAKVKSYGLYGLENKIAGELFFKRFAAPKYGSENAKQNADGSWSVSLKGNMTGYTDEYATKVDTKTFSVSATVREDGTVENLKIN